MATASEVKLCPYCDVVLPIPRPDRCPACRRALPGGKSKPVAFFECPDYLWFQKDVLTKMPDRKPKEEERKETREYLIEVDNDLTDFVRGASAETLNAALFDAHLILTHAIHAKIDGMALKKLVVTARAIGKIAEAIDQYMKSGGTISDDGASRESGRLFSGEGGDSWSTTATADGGSIR